jgi:excisionase family DNA binding protein
MVQHRHVGEGRTGARGDQGATELLTVSEAAEVLGISAEAVRMRIRRGTMRSERHEGTVYVVLDTNRTQRVADATHDRTEELIDALRDQVRDLRNQLEAERQGHAEARRIIAALVQRVPELEAPREPREQPETAAEGEGAARVPGEAQEATEPRSWWRRVFGG